MEARTNEDRMDVPRKFVSLVRSVDKLFGDEQKMKLYRRDGISGMMKRFAVPLC